MTLVVQAGKGRLYGGGLKSVARFGGQCRALWNLFLAETVARYEAEQKFVFYAEMSARSPWAVEGRPAPFRLAAPLCADDRSEARP